MSFSSPISTKIPSTTGRSTWVLQLLLALMLSSFQTTSAQIFDWDTKGECYVEAGCDGELLLEGEVTFLECYCAGGGSFSWCYKGPPELWFCTAWEDGCDECDGDEPTPSALLVSDDGSKKVAGVATPMPPPQRLLRQHKNRNLQDSGGFFFTLTMTDTCGGGVIGDPHIKLWTGEQYDYHGECDLVFLNAPGFGNGVGLDVHIRTKIDTDYSYVESAAIRIGDDILEVSSYGEHRLNGVSDVALPALLSGYRVHQTRADRTVHKFSIELAKYVSIEISTLKRFVSVRVQSKAALNSAGMLDSFGGSSGLMGSYATGEMLARDGLTIMNDPNEFGQEWQVQDSEPMLFDTDRFPQFPQHKCLLPLSSTDAKESRRLAELIPRDVAEKACEKWGTDKEHCVYDVMATGDLDLALAGAY